MLRCEVKHKQEIEHSQNGDQIKSVRAGSSYYNEDRPMPASFRDSDQPLLYTSGENPWCNERKRADNKCKRLLVHI